jgi:hypothetical protein
MLLMLVSDPVAQRAPRVFRHFPQLRGGNLPEVFD